jgi:uroporphyrinogen decarboxylase
VRYSDGMVKLLDEGDGFRYHTLEYPIRNGDDWSRYKKNHLDPHDPSRFPADWSQKVEAYRQRDYPLMLKHHGVYGFARNIMGDEALMLAMFDCPELVHDMMDSFTSIVVTIWKKVVREVDIDLIEVWEDMASKHGCLISPKAFREFMAPNYRRIADFARENGVRIVLVDSDGQIEGLAPLMQEAGVTAMYPFEAGAGNDLFRIREQMPAFGMLGGLEKEALLRSKTDIDAELAKAERAIKLGRFIPGPDHGLIPGTPAENALYFWKGLENVIKSTRPGHPI